MINEYALCAGGVEGKTTQVGDSGAPYVVPLPDGGWGQVGIHNLSGGALDRVLDYPLVLTRTSAIYDWIHQHIAGGLQFSRLDAGQVLTSERGRLNFLAGNRFQETDPEGAVRTGSYAFQSHGSRTGTLTLTYDDDTGRPVRFNSPLLPRLPVRPVIAAVMGVPATRASKSPQGTQAFSSPSC